MAVASDRQIRFEPRIANPVQLIRLHVPAGGGFDTAQASLHYLSLLRNSTRAGTGKGLGLFLVRRICERFRWTLTLESMPTLGTRAELDFRTRLVQYR
ncbi:Sensor histidine kinase [Pseudomonas syringae pv. actinidiae]|uniref:Sensor histidine kinase n=1 Tax=Pseudomonas syringae pv. actinidiae TaxID=103796 RepID=A0A7Z6XX15_PSESF|nr:Sensor histidine kinase [Pseudomonas syringae pv. actinidiae]RMR60322.1 Sensor histidine kinase [Pseudomonas syringae pv. actinidiae]